MSSGSETSWLSVLAWVLAPIGGIGGIGAVVWWALGKPSFKQVRRYVKSFFVEPAPGTHFTVLIADLEGDEDLEQTKLLAQALVEARGLEVISKGRTLADADIGGGTRAREEAEETGQEWLAEHNADVLVWGHATGSGLKLHFLPREGKGSKPEGYRRFGEEFDLPRDFEKALGAQLVALALSHVAPATEQQGTYLVSLLRPAATKLKNLLAEQAATLSVEQKASLHSSLGLAASTVGEQAGESQWLEEAVAAFRSALEERTRERVPLDWAMTQNSLGAALRTLGEREGDTARLADAVTAYRAALEERTRERVPLDWAGTQNNLGNVLLRLGERESGTARLTDAVAAYRAALKEYTRERAPLQWAMTQNNLGNALATLGERESGTARLADAVAAFRAALEEYTRERVPLDWAMTQNNLGAALRVLGEQESGTARLDEAVAALRAALKEYTRERLPLDWAMTQNNLGNALSILGERESGTARLEDAVAAFQGALEVYEAAGADYFVNLVKKNLKKAEAALEARKKRR